jgi:hypothetical protein
MRGLIELLIVAGIIYLGWSTPFKQRIDQVRAAVHAAGQAVSKQAATPSAEIAATPEAATPVPQYRPMIQATPQHGAWMWDPNHHAPLDRPTSTPTVHP